MLEDISEYSQMSSLMTCGAAEGGEKSEKTTIEEDVDSMINPIQNKMDHLTVAS